jgi:hypothetical protein
MLVLKSIFFKVWCLCCVTHVKWVPCYQSMAHHQVADGGDGLQLWRIAGNILNTQLQTAVRGRYSSLGGWVGGLTTPHHKTSNLLRIMIKSLGPGRISLA